MWVPGRNVSQVLEVASAKARDRAVLGIPMAGAERVTETKAERRQEVRSARAWQAL